LGDLGADGKVILNFVAESWDIRCGLDSCDSEQCLFVENVKTIMNSIKSGKILD
jgi:hypothetical protein